MTEPAGAAAPTAGALLRAARERQGLHIAALAAAIKVTPRKLEALENDRLGELPDATFARALAQTVCRFLKIDPQPVLALLPSAGSGKLEQVAGTLNTPFRERSGRDGPGLSSLAIRPMVWAAAALVVGALAIYLVPDTVWQRLTRQSPPETVAVPLPKVSTAASTASGASSTPPPQMIASPFAPSPEGPASATPAPVVVAETVFSAPPPGASAAGGSAPAAGTVLVRTSDPSWVEARDGQGQLLLFRTVQPGESVGLDGTRPIRLTIGNAAATQLADRGQPVDLAPRTQGNVARVELR